VLLLFTIIQQNQYDFSLTRAVSITSRTLNSIVAISDEKFMKKARLAKSSLPSDRKMAPAGAIFLSEGKKKLYQRGIYY
jgi:hypothetical protein